MSIEFTQRFFTFGQNHHATHFVLPRGGCLADYWVEVRLTKGCDLFHRQVFIDGFTSVWCPSPAQFAFEYKPVNWKPSYFPKKRLLLLSENGPIDENCEDCDTVLIDTPSFVHWPDRKEGPYKMCDVCTHHSVKNRGAEVLK